MALSAHEQHGSRRQGGVESPGEPGFREGPAIGTAAEALGEVETRVTLTTVDLVVGTGEVAHGMPVVGIGEKERVVDDCAGTGAIEHADRVPGAAGVRV